MSSNLEEKIKRYWNTQPCNIKHGKSDVGTPEFFHEVSERRYRVEPHIAEFAGFICGLASVCWKLVAVLDQMLRSLPNTVLNMLALI